jgi:ABC-type proline/glycine betaine transport system permease subunit
MNRLEQDTRFALRGFARTPSFTVTAVLILAVGIGMAVAMFSVFDRVLVQELPVAHSAAAGVNRIRPASRSSGRG